MSGRVGRANGSGKVNTVHSPDLHRNSTAGSPMRDGSISNEMLDVKLGRKRAESDLQLLANRIALLKSEEQRALSKVSETKNRSIEIIGIKKRNEEAMQAKIRASTEREINIRSAQERAYKNRHEQSQKLSMSKKAINDSRREAANSAKEETRKLGEIARQNRDFAAQEKRRKAEEAKQRRKAATENRERERREKEQAALMQYQLKLNEEAARRQEAEDMIAMLEKEEKDLISRLRRTQELQEKAYGTLQKSLADNR